MLQKTLAEHKVMWSKYSDLTDQWKDDKNKLAAAQDILRDKKVDLQAAQAPFKCVLPDAHLN